MTDTTEMAMVVAHTRLDHATGLPAPFTMDAGDPAVAV